MPLRSQREPGNLGPWAVLQLGGCGPQDYCSIAWQPGTSMHCWKSFSCSNSCMLNWLRTCSTCSTCSSICVSTREFAASNFLTVIITISFLDLASCQSSRNLHNISVIKQEHYHTQAKTPRLQCWKGKHVYKNKLKTKKG